MSVEIKTRIDAPFDWLHETTWDWIADSVEACEYAYLDHIYWCLCEGRNPDDFGELRGMTEKELKEEYQNRFPLMFAEALKNIASDIEDGEIKLKIDFYE